MGVSVSEGTVVEWHKQVGDWVEYEETIAAISTDKIDTDVPAPAAGRLAEIVVDVGTTVDVGVVLARLATDARPGEAHAAELPASVTTTNEEIDGESEAAAALGATPATHDDTDPAPVVHTPAGAPAIEAAPGGSKRYSPVVLRIAAEHGVDLAKVPGTGRGGRVSKRDVLAFLAQGNGAAPAVAEPPLHIESPYRPDPPAPAPAPATTAVTGGEPLSRMRRQIGQAMRRSLDTAATCTTWIEVDMSRVEARRRESGLTALPYVARATVETLRDFPALNAWLEDDRRTLHDDVNLGIAVSLGEDGLIVPVVPAAQDLSVEGLSKRIRDLARRGRAKQLTPDDVQGGTFTITNPGQFGSIMATPVIDLPQVAILDLEAVVKRAVVVTDELGSDSIAIRPMCIFGMSWDHRALDGVYAAQFLAALKARVESV
jgi:pyruvate/2-oxoglutarate dehydrogenase complex dihydrolipoamide acyltransferase (E2) component